MIITRYFNDKISTSALDPELAGKPIGQIVIRPNNSTTWRTTQWFLTFLIITSLSVAVAFTINGYWLILPFSIIEMSIVAACMVYCFRRNYNQEVLSFSSETLIFEAGGRQPDVHLTWQRFFTKFLVQPAKHPWYSRKIFVLYKGQQRELGKYLSDGDKQKLVSALSAMVHTANHPTN